ncbi:hypothetical protein [Aminipila sp.]|uniref:hypothetical protein n=1 Tax=Aminipila sp. TaxID=2060095 RepID=UPI00289AF42A|nr:hypothetical protein [Aminipila sp.]
MKEEIIALYNVEWCGEEYSLEKKYSKAGVWALWAENTEGKRICLEVAQTVNIYGEISSALYILSTKDDSKCKGCTDKYPARRRNNEYSVSFNIHKCKSCQYISGLRTKSWKRNPRYIDKYKDMLLNYQNFYFVLVDMSSDMEKGTNRYNTEKEYAKIHQALYWWG